jgi:hypothetical protein
MSGASVDQYSVAIGCFLNDDSLRKTEQNVSKKEQRIIYHWNKGKVHMSHGK